MRLGATSGCQNSQQNPVHYLSNLGISSLFRFVLTHPDMDHLDGFDALFQSVEVTNFWHTGVERNAPEFGEGSRYNGADWDRYEYVKNKQQAGVTVSFPFGWLEVPLR